MSEHKKSKVMMMVCYNPARRASYLTRCIREAERVTLAAQTDEGAAELLRMT